MDLVGTQSAAKHVFIDGSCEYLASLVDFFPDGGRLHLMYSIRLSYVLFHGVPEAQYKFSSEFCDAPEVLGQ